MRGAGHRFNVMSETEEDTLHRNVVRIVSSVGIQIENDALLECMAGAGAQVDRGTSRVTWNVDTVEAFIAAAPQYDWENHQPTVSGDASLFHGKYLDPESDEFEPLNVARARAFYQVARAMSRVKSMGMLGCPLEEAQGALEPLYEKYWAWRLGVKPWGAIHDVRLCPYIAEMFEIHASFTGQDAKEIFTGSVWMCPPFRLAYIEAEQVAWFHSRGYRVSIGGSNVTGGATGPATLSGMVSVGIAECILQALMNRALYGQAEWGLFISVTAMDARTAMRSYARPDMALATLIVAQMSRRYGVSFTGHSGLSDTARPSPQAAAQKMQSALPTLMVGGHAEIPSGLLGVDEVFSPLQLVLDDQMMSALGQFARTFEVTDESIGFDTIAAVGPGGNYLTQDHTAEWLRREVWEPDIWERKGFEAWRQQDGKTDIDRARARVTQILAKSEAGDAIGHEEIVSLERVIERARKAVS